MVGAIGTFGARLFAEPRTLVPPGDLPTARKYLIFAVMAFGQFMALIDIQIVAASLNDVQAGLSAGPDEISWVQTGYLMAELVMIPFSAFLAQALSTRWLFAISAGLFTVSSGLCGAAWDIQSMIVFRVMQGFVGGAMVPTVFAVGFQLFSGKQRAMIPAILGMVGVLAPTLGPTVGGFLTDAVGWRSIFYVNIIPGAVVTVLALILIRVDRPNLSMLKKIDYAHLASMAIFLGGMEYVLEEGPKNDWFNDPKIMTAAWVAFVAFLLFLERSFRSGGPVVRLTPFRRPTFVFACVFNLVIGFGLYSSTYLVPVFLGRVRGYDSLQIGTTVVVAGVAQVLSVVIAARLSQIVDPRKVITVGLTVFAASLWCASSVTPDWGFGAWLIPQALRGFALMLCIVPSVGLALTGFEGAELRAASGLFNLMRNLGGAIGIAVVNTWLADTTRIQVARMGEALGETGRHAPDVLAAMAGRLSGGLGDADQALMAARAQFARVVGRYALTTAFDEVFRTMAWVFLAALVLVPFCRPAPQTAAPPAGRPLMRLAMTVYSVPHVRLTLTALALAASVSACAVGPDYHRPDMALTPAFHTPAPVAATQTTTLDAWWTGFGDAELVRVVERAAAQNLDLAQARARLTQSRAAAKAAGAALLPSANVTGSVADGRQSVLSPLGEIGNHLPGFPRDYDDYALNAGAAWEIDLFGGLRRERQAAVADAKATRAQAEAVKVAVEADAADAYLQVRAYQARLAVAHKQETVRQDLVALLNRRIGEGVSPERELHEAQAELEAVRAAVPPLTAGLDAQLNRLDVLMGAQPGTYRAELIAEGPVPALPSLTMTTTPADLLRRRPDIIVAEQRLIAANARIGAAISGYYPKVSLSALFGVDSLDSSRIFSGDAMQRQIAAGFRWRLFDFGRVDAEVVAAKGKDAEALAAYRASVLKAAEEVENAFSDLTQDEARAAALDRQITELTTARRQAQEAYEGGVISLIEVRDADRDILGASDQLAQARAGAARAAVASFRALGGGWGGAQTRASLSGEALAQGE